jgi:hypothetical protein
MYGGYGKHFASMYEGSMYGMGAVPFAVWGYVISHYDEQGYVELNPRMLADTIGEDEVSISAAITQFEKPDPNSRFKAEQGRRLVREGQFLYRVPSAPEYRKIWNREHRREYLREKKRESRERQKQEASTELNSKHPSPTQRGNDGEHQRRRTKTTAETVDRNVDNPRRPR